MAERWQLEARYPIGTMMVYEATGGRVFVGRVGKHNQKTLAVTAVGEVVAMSDHQIRYHPCEEGRWWRIPWVLLEGRVIKAWKDTKGLWPR